MAVIDYHLGDGRDGLSLTADFKAPEHGPRVLIYSAFSDLGSAVSALIAGADGQDQANFEMLIDGIDSEVIAERLAITQQDLQHRRSVMLRSLTPPKTPVGMPSGARAPLDYERARRAS